MKPSRSVLLLALVVLVASPAQAAEDKVIADFEGADYAGWIATGTAFGTRPAGGALPGQMHVDGFHGSGLVNSFHGGDGATGTLTSPEFTVERRHLSFLIGGGRDAERTCLQLVVDGRMVRNATGPNDHAGGSEALAPESWDVAEFIGQKAVLRIIDTATGGWGHINVDHLVQTDTRPPGILTDASRDFQVAHRYLHLPIRTGAPKRKVTTLVDGKVEVVNDIELADGPAEWWAPMDVSAWKGRTVTLRVDRLREDSKALSAIEASDTLRDAADLYREPARGQFHFSPSRGWNNDPNGLVFFNGEYHLFFQHNPYGWAWGNMHWGHAVSRDLVHWTELGDVLAPDRFGPMFSGSAVVDWNNTSGLGSDGKPPLVLIYTAAGDPTVQCIASSTDGRNFTKHPGNPVLPQITAGNRDPKVFWHAATQRWVMVLYVELQKRHTVHFFTSPNLRDWTHTSTSEGLPGSNYLYECPDFFELPVDGNPAQRRWILLGANSEYAVGTFDGRAFTPEHSRLPGHRGRGFYAPQTFSDIPAADGRRIMIGWFQTETRGTPFNQSMSVPLELRLTGTPAGPRLAFHPVAELSTLRTGSVHLPPGTVLEPGRPNTLGNLRAELLEVRAHLRPSPSANLRITVRGTHVDYEASRQELVVQGLRAPAALSPQGDLRITVFVDRTGLEIFADEGRTFMPVPVNAQPGDKTFQIESREAATEAVSLEVHTLRSAWPSP